MVTVRCDCCGKTVERNQYATLHIGAFYERQSPSFGQGITLTPAHNVPSTYYVSAGDLKALDLCKECRSGGVLAKMLAAVSHK